MSVGSLLHEEDCARGSQEYDQCGYRVGDAGPRYPALKPASGAKYAGIAYPAAIIVPGLLPGIASRRVHLQGSLTRFQTRESRPAFLFLLVVVAPCALAYFPVQILSPSVALLRFPGVGCAFFSAGVSPGSVARFFHLGVALLRSGW